MASDSSTQTLATRALMQTEEHNHSTSQRKEMEPDFGELWHIRSLVRLRLLGRTRAKDEFLMTATVKNLNRPVKNAKIPSLKPIAV